MKGSVGYLEASCSPFDVRTSSTEEPTRWAAAGLSLKTNMSCFNHAHSFTPARNIQLAS